MQIERHRPLEAGGRMMFPGVEYEVIAPFKDQKGATHEAGEKWTLYGWKYFGISQVELFILDSAGRFDQFGFSYDDPAQEEVVRNFDKHVWAQIPAAEQVVRALSAEGKAALALLDPDLRSTARSSEEFLLALSQAITKAAIASSRDGIAGNPFEVCEQALTALQAEFLQSLYKILVEQPDPSAPSQTPAKPG